MAKVSRIFEQLALQGMAYDYSWKKAGDIYEGVYDYIRVK